MMTRSHKTTSCELVLVFFFFQLSITFALTNCETTPCANIVVTIMIWQLKTIIKQYSIDNIHI